MEAKFSEALAAISDDEILEIEKGLVAIPSYTTEEAEIAEHIADLLNDAGIEVGLQRVPFDDIPFSRTKKSYNVVARIHGTGDGPSLMFNGHMDHGPIGGRDLENFSRWKRKPFQPVVENGFLYGKGCQDEKGGICAMLTAALVVRRLKLSLRGDLIVAPVCGHKTYSRGSRHLVASGIRTTMAVNTENSGNGIVPVHVGVFKAEVTVKGAHPHPAIRWRNPEIRTLPTPAERAQQFINALGPEARPYADRSWLRFERHPVLKDFPWHHIEQIESNGSLGRTVHVWWRTPPGVTEATLKEDLEGLVRQMRDGDPSFEATVRMESYGPALDTPTDAPVVQAFARWHREVSGEEPDVGPNGRYGGYGDAAVLAAAGMQAIAYGPGGGLSDLEHQRQAMFGEVPPDERIPVRELIVAARTSALATIDLLS
jgi:acetylornithine deacetylase